MDRRELLGPTHQLECVPHAPAAHEDEDADDVLDEIPAEGAGTSGVTLPAGQQNLQKVLYRDGSGGDEPRTMKLR